MDQSKIAQVARAIYKQHSRALEVLFEHRPDNLQSLSEAVRSMLEEQATKLGIEITSSIKTRIRFVPLAWNLPGNSHGSAWTNCRHTVLFELKLVGSYPTLQIVSGKPPRPWIDELWQLTENPPFKRQKKRSGPGTWVKLHHAGTSKVLIDEEQTEDDNAPAQIVDWCQKVLRDQNTQEAIRVIADAFPALDDYYRTQPL